MAFVVVFTMSLCALGPEKKLNKFAISNHMFLKLSILALRSLFKANL